MIRQLGMHKINWQHKKNILITALVQQKFSQPNTWLRQMA